MTTLNYGDTDVMKCVYRYEHPTDGRQEKTRQKEKEKENRTKTKTEGETRARAEEDAVFFCGRLQTATDS
jgi:hypothetical protein